MTPARRTRVLLAVAKWTGTAAGVCGATLLALNLGVEILGFALFLTSSLLWCAAGIAQRESSLIVLQTAFTAINLIGLWRWSMPG